MKDGKTEIDHQSATISGEKKSQRASQRGAGIKKMKILTDENRRCMDNNGRPFYETRTQRGNTPVLKTQITCKKPAYQATIINNLTFIDCR